MDFVKSNYFKKVTILILFWLKCSCIMAASAGPPSGLPPGFVYLKDIDPTIIQDMRYAGYHNFTGRPVSGYQAAECILTRPAAIALSRVQRLLKPSSLSLKVYDCYRPQQAVNEFIVWSRQPDLQEMKAEFYPRVNKADFFKLGYVAAKSGHSRGSTMDLTLVSLPPGLEEHYITGQKLRSCFAPYAQRFHDGGIDMGTGFDCLDPAAHFANPAIQGKPAAQNRAFLKSLMQRQGFVPYPVEWWHFTLRDEPFPQTYFNFPIRPQ